MNLPCTIEQLAQLAREAGAATLRYWQQNPDVQHKADDSPVTAADLAAHDLLLAGLRKLTPGIPVISEEAADIPLAERADWPRFWLLDPLDGTKEFIDGSDEYTVNIALIENAQVRFGLVGVPARDTLYWGGHGLGAWRQRGQQKATPLHTRQPGAEISVVASRRHSGPEQQALLDTMAQKRTLELVSIGSSLKFCLLAEGAADFYPRLAPTCQWDTAAAQAVLEGAGGQVLKLNGQRFDYPSRDSWLNPHFIACGWPDPAWLQLLRG
ncbi:3'(2'),5'-bisphosphate nucleotidase CysQ [Halopseudomonas salegens]|uniref:3'(2'),5'-bisphosphate nucleotidase CysQ n=1 Tax=Halopseudomonas salegens TaxID=1434072 RepID=A0A1H2GZB7_9GAMM|nr:3'(2'),5'-bisphosphate nucleotidase CysQ [Halopseudomonas salegens]SDU24950.1 3'(2'), 5'-bisphosphate nucleotidase [Halopseudomonas salegens]